MTLANKFPGTRIPISAPRCDRENTSLRRTPEWNRPCQRQRDSKGLDIKYKIAIEI